MDVNNQRKPLLYYWLIALLIMGVINIPALYDEEHHRAGEL